jgi:hypothetical protein
VIYWLFSGGGFKIPIHLRVAQMLRKRDGLPDGIFGISCGSLIGDLAAQDQLDVAEEMITAIDDPNPLDGIKGFLSPSLHRWKGFLSLKPMREKAEKLASASRLKTRFGCGIVLRDPLPGQSPYQQPEWGPGVAAAASGGLTVPEGLHGSSAVGLVMEPLDASWEGRPALISDGGHDHVFPMLPPDVPLKGTTIHAVGCSALAGPQRTRKHVDGLFEAAVWSFEHAMHAAYLGDIERLRGYAQAGAEVYLYLPNRSTGGMLQADAATIADRLAMSAWMAANPRRL